MRNSYRTGPTKTIFATAASWLSALGAFLLSPLLKVNSMLFAVAVLTQRFPVANVKAMLRVFCPRFYVVCVKLSGCFAANALKTIPRKNGYSPFAALRHQARSLIDERFSAFPVSCLRTNQRFSCAPLRAKASAFVSGIKSNAAVLAMPRFWWVARRPTSLAAKFRRCGAVGVNPVLTTADGAAQLCSSAPRRNRHALGSHTDIVPESPAYYDVIVERWQNLTGGKATR